MQRKISKQADQHHRQLSYFPIYLQVQDRAILICGATEDSLAKIRILLKTSAEIIVYDTNFSADFLELAAISGIKLVTGSPDHAAIKQAVMGYIGYAHAEKRQQMRRAFNKAGTPVCLIDEKQASDFITPAIIDRAPVTIAIGSEGLAPIMVRRLKSIIEKIVPLYIGRLTQLAGALRPLAEILPKGAVRRSFWSQIFDNKGPEIVQNLPPKDQASALEIEAKKLIEEIQHAHSQPTTTLTFVSAGPGDAGLLTRQAEAALHEADVIIYDRLVSASVLELGRREARYINVGKKGFGDSVSQPEINKLLQEFADSGQKIVRLKGGDAGLFGRLDEEIEAVQQSGLSFKVLAGVTSAAAMAAEMGVSLTKRGRNRKVSFVTGYQLGGYADHDWRQLAGEGAVTALYMGRKAASFVQGRLLMFGADPNMPVTIASDLASPSTRYSVTKLAEMSDQIDLHYKQAPLLILLGLAPHAQFAKAQPAPQTLYPQQMVAR